MALTLFADEDNVKILPTLLRKLQPSAVSEWFSVRPIRVKSEAWKQLFKLCASQRLFLPEVMSDVSRVIYVDTDTIFLRDPADLWDIFDRFNATQLAAMVWPVFTLSAALPQS